MTFVAGVDTVGQEFGREEIAAGDEGDAVVL